VRHLQPGLGALAKEFAGGVCARQVPQTLADEQVPLVGRRAEYLQQDLFGRRAVRWHADLFGGLAALPLADVFGRLALYYDDVCDDQRGRACCALGGPAAHLTSRHGMCDERPSVYYYYYYTLSKYRA